MLWLGHSLAVLTVPRFLMIPSDRTGISDQPQRGAEPCSRIPRTLGNPSLILSHPSLLGTRPASREMLGTCPGRVPGGTGQDSALRLAWGNEQLTYALENYKPCEVGPLGTKGKRVHIEMLPGGGGICNGY